MKNLHRLFVVLVCISMLVLPTSAAYTRNKASYGSNSGLNIDAWNEAAAEQSAYALGNKDSTIVAAFDTFRFAPGNNGGFQVNTYTATGEADGTGGFDIEVDIPAGGIVVATQLRVDVAITATTGVSWSGAFIDGSTASVGTGLAFTQNLKVNAFFDVNAATGILSTETDLRITPNAGSLDEGFITAFVTVLEFVALDNTKAITYSAETFAEVGGNDGSTTTALTLTASGFTYAWANAVDYVASGYATVTNVPAGLTAVLTKTSDTVLTLTLTGNAAAHDDADDVADLTIALGNNAFGYGVLAADVIAASKDDVAISYTTTSMAYSAATFTEAVANDGSVDTSITITLSGDTFTGADADDFVDDSKIVVTNLSTGLTAVATRTSDTVLTVTMTGTATAHATAQDVADLTFTFADTAFSTDAAAEVTNYAKADLVIDFAD